MDISAIVGIVRNSSVFRDTLSRLGGAASPHVQGLVASARSLFVEAIRAETGRPVVLVCAGEEEVDRAYARLNFFCGADGWQRFQHSVNLAGDPALVDARVGAARVGTLFAMANGQPRSLVTTIGAILQPTIPPEDLQKHTAILRAGAFFDLRELTDRLAKLGYESTLRVTDVGEFSRRGGIIDIYPPGVDLPYRVEFFGDEIENVRTFDTETQRSVETAPFAVALPPYEMILDPARCDEAATLLLDARENGSSAEATEIAGAYPWDQIEKEIEKLGQSAYFDGVERYRGLLGMEEHCLLSYLAPDTILVIDEPSRVGARWDELQAELALRPAAYIPTWRKRSFAEILEQLGERSRMYLSRVAAPSRHFGPIEHIEIDSDSLEFFSQDLEAISQEGRRWLEQGSHTFLITEKLLRMTELLNDANLPTSAVAAIEDPVVHVVEGTLDAGFKIDAMKLAVLSESDIFGTRAVTERMLSRARRGKRESVPITSYLDISPGDYLVHINHGIGRYVGMTTLETDGAEQEYLYIEYGGGGKLYVPADQVDRVQRYIGGDDSPPKLNSLGSTEWQRTKSRVKKRVREMAAELIEIYAARQAAEGTSFSPDSPWQAEMEAAFVYSETPGQAQAIDEVKQDLETPKPMDRLICGDVGYGKTEVAIRAAFKVVLDGKQVAVLVPTTVLAEQHLSTFRERLSAYPVRVEALSRFRSKKEQSGIVDEVGVGAVDIIIGTHRLLSKDVAFKDLGLLIVDEEQRFGVAHKEKLKQLRKTVDVLTLTATPIPRTLHMSLAGIRDMSVINDPPEGRIPIKTRCDEFSDDTVRSAILREIERDGQVYYVHNRVAEISHVAEHVKRLVPHARVVVGHGQMPESGLEKVMMEFYHHEFDVLVCTTIIESGLDIPNVNTIIIDDAERYGLATLYQLRGRVGRSERQAYAYFLHRQGLVLKDTAWKRIEAIREFSDLGSGFKIALRDLEIRGAGDLLGAEQHGFMVSVGFDLYCQMLADAVRELKGEETAEQPLPEISLPVDAHIPKEYVQEDAERIIMYKKIAGSGTAESLATIAEELVDRFGKLPRQAQNLLEVARVRMAARDARVHRVGIDRDSILVELERGAHLIDPEVALLNQKIAGAVAMPNQIRLPRDHRDPVKKIEILIREFLAHRRTVIS